MGNPDKAKESIMGIMTVARIFKNLFFFPIETVVITLFLKVYLQRPFFQLLHCPL